MNYLTQFAEALFFGTFMTKKTVEFILTSFGTINYDFVMKTIKMFNFLPLISNSVTTGFSFLILTISAMITAETTNMLRFLPRLYSAIFL